MRDKREAFTRLPRSYRLCVFEGIVGDAWWERDVYTFTTFMLFMGGGKETLTRLHYRGHPRRCVIRERRLHVYHVHVVYALSRAS